MPSNLRKNLRKKLRPSECEALTAIFNRENPSPVISSILADVADASINADAVWRLFVRCSPGSAAALKTCREDRSCNIRD